MKVSEKGINLIKKYEGCRLKAYKCPAGVWTIGWGHTAGVKAGDKITQEQADKFLVEDIKIYEDRVNKYSKYNWNQNQFDALVSFAYNIGSIDQLTANGTRSIKTISEKIPAYCNAGNKKLEGLVRRRNAEKALFDKVEDSTTEKSFSEAKEGPQNSSTASKPLTSSEAQEKQKKSLGKYIPGRVYTVVARTALNVRTGPGKNYRLVGYTNLTADGKKHAYPSGALKNGTRVTALEFKVYNDNNIWARIPSGWICVIDGEKTLVK